MALFYQRNLFSSVTSSHSKRIYKSFMHSRATETRPGIGSMSITKHPVPGLLFMLFPPGAKAPHRFPPDPPGRAGHTTQDYNCHLGGIPGSPGATPATSWCWCPAAFSSCREIQPRFRRESPGICTRQESPARGYSCPQSSSQIRRQPRCHRCRCRRHPSAGSPVGGTSPSSIPESADNWFPGGTSGKHPSR